METGAPFQEYVFNLSNTKKRFYYLFALFIIIINAVVLALVRLNDTEAPLTNWRLLAIIIYALLFTVLFFIRPEKEKSILAVFTFTLIIAAWLMMKELLPATVNLLILLLFKISTRPLKIKVSKENISYPSFPVQNIAWNELNNIILKDGLLTIDLKNNKIYQHYPDEINLVDEVTFNLFCKQNLQTAG